MQQHASFPSSSSLPFDFPSHFPPSSISLSHSCTLALSLSVCLSLCLSASLSVPHIVLSPYDLRTTKEIFTVFNFLPATSFVTQKSWNFCVSNIYSVVSLPPVALVVISHLPYLFSHDNSSSLDWMSCHTPFCPTPLHAESRIGHVLSHLVIGDNRPISRRSTHSYHCRCYRNKMTQGDRNTGDFIRGLV